MAVNNVVINGETVLDLRNATATAADILEGATAYGASGELLVGTARAGSARQEYQLTLSASGWTSDPTTGDWTQTVSTPAVSSNSTVFVGPDDGSQQEYEASEVWCCVQGAGTLTFHAVYPLLEDVVANVAVFS